MAFQREVEVLIETYWNVKLFLLRCCQVGISVLIETYWNVKSDRTGDHTG